MIFTHPYWLLLGLLLPLSAWIGWPVSKTSRRRDLVSLSIRLVLLSALVLSLAGLEIVRRGDDLAVVFLVDVSDSMPPQAIQQEIDFVESALGNIGPNDRAAVILFGADALIERPMLSGDRLDAISSIPVTSQTDLAEAITLGMALFPSDSAGRMVILSDGRQTSGDALEAARLAQSAGVQIVVSPFVIQTDNETLVTAVEAPDHLIPGEQFDLNVSLQAGQPTRAALRILSDNRILYQQIHDLNRGTQTFSLPLTAEAPGFVSYQVQIVPEKDVYYQNNRLDAFSQVDGPPRVLVVAPLPGETLPGGDLRPDEHTALVQVLGDAGYTVEWVTPARLTSDLPTLAQYNAILLVNVPARTLDSRQMSNLQSYVHDLGGGLLAVGGPNSFGVGGYYDTPLEEMLPVQMQVKDQQRHPTLALVFIIDRSGSMSTSSSGDTKLELAKEAAARSIELLFPTDRVGVITFDDAASWVVPMTDLSNPQEITGAIGGIGTGGGTDILAGLQAMARVLPDEPARVKHVILLTDGGADPSGIPELVERLHTRHGITLSTVGIGRDAAPFLEDLAAIGGGRYHFTTDAGSIPSIFTEETTLAARAYLVEKPFFPTLANPSPILDGIESLPRLHGYVASSPKDLARVILQSEEGDPILAAWQYGLGRSVAFTSDASGRWGKDWVRSEVYARFWVQAVRYTLNPAPDIALETDIRLEGEKARLTLDTRSLSGEFLNDYQVDVKIVGPQATAQTVSLHQIAPGRYEGFFNPREEGIYLLHISGSSQPGASFSRTTGWALSYSPEYLYIESDPDFLLRLAALTNGSAAPENPAGVFTHDLESVRARRPAWPWLVLLAILLLPIDAAVRRLMITRQDLRSAVRRLLSLFDTSLAAPAAAADERLKSLREARDRARSREPAGTCPPEAIPRDASPEAGEKPEAPPASTGIGVKSPPEKDTPRSTTASLLERKKALRDRKKE
ncbi:MAG: VWA domain-containing protein [Anaerolineales bacterium]|nr:VWA domain-containing protein [Anaerolineales bacterium]